MGAHCYTRLLSSSSLSIFHPLYCPHISLICSSHPNICFCQKTETVAAPESPPSFPDSWRVELKSDRPLIWILHLRDHQRPPCRCHPVSLSPLLLSDHPQQHISHYLITYLQAYLLHPLPALLPFLPPPRGRLSRYHPLLLLLLFFPIPWSLFWFQTPFGWSIGASLENDSEVVWTVVDSLLGGRLPPLPLIYSSLHWLMDRGVQRSTFYYGRILTWKQINTLFVWLAEGQNGTGSVLCRLSIVEGKWRSCDFGAVGQEGSIFRNYSVRAYLTTSKQCFNDTREEKKKVLLIPSYTFPLPTLIFMGIHF